MAFRVLVYLPSALLLLLGLAPLVSTSAQPAPNARSAPAAASTAAPAANWSPSRVDVFVTNAMYVGNAGRARIHRVDDRQQVERELTGTGLPGDPEQARAIVMQRMKTMGAQLNERVIASLEAVKLSVAWNIQRVPAIVFDGQRAVYGVTDVERALAIARAGGGEPVRLRFHIDGWEAR